MSVAGFLNTIESLDLRCVAEHWLQARGDKLMPTWSQIRPSSVAKQLPIIWSFVYDQDRDEFFGRLGGHAITKILERNLKGVAMADLEPVLDQKRLVARARRVVKDPALFRGVGEIFKSQDRQGWGERIIMPLGSDRPKEIGVLGATVYQINHFPREMGKNLEIEEWYPLALP